MFTGSLPAIEWGRKRGRPKSRLAKLPKPKMGKVLRPSEIDIDAVLSGQAFERKLMSTSTGGMKIEFKNNLFEYHFDRKGIKYYRCQHHVNHKCTARIITKDCLVYSVVEKHNHADMVNTTTLLPSSVVVQGNKSPDNNKVAAVPNLKLLMNMKLAALQTTLTKK